MGRPLNKKHFGTDANSFKVLAKVAGKAEGYGTIVKQTGTHTFDVLVDGVKGRCNLSTKDAGTLVNGEMVIHTRNTSGTVLAVKSIKGRTATLENGTTVKWDFAAATGGKVEAEATGDTFSAPVTPVITITTQPASQSKTVGQTATFSVVASVAPTATLTYQWKKNGTNISGATAASYTTPALASGDNNAVFTVVVSSAGATSVTSANATLTVA